MKNRRMLHGALVLLLSLGLAAHAEETNAPAGAKIESNKMEAMAMEGAEFAAKERGKFGDLRGDALWSHAQVRAQQVRPSQPEELQAVWAKTYMVVYDAASSAAELGSEAGYTAGQRRKNEGLGIPTHKELDELAARAITEDPLMPMLPQDTHARFATAYKQAFKVGYTRNDPAW